MVKYRHCFCLLCFNLTKTRFIYFILAEVSLFTFGFLLPTELLFLFIQYDFMTAAYVRLAVRSVSICVRERPQTFGNLANHSSPISERPRTFDNLANHSSPISKRSRSFANKTAYWTYCCFHWINLILFKLLNVDKQWCVSFE